jgi:hypothetical protein
MEKKLWSRRCSVTGEGMNEGWVWGDGVFYTKYESDTLKECRRDREFILGIYDDIDVENLLSECELTEAILRARRNEETDEDLLLIAFNGGYVYHTEWEGDDAQYEELPNGSVVELTSN